MNIKSAFITAGTLMLLGVSVMGCSSTAAPDAVGTSQKPPSVKVNQPSTANPTPGPSANSPTVPALMNTAASNSGYEVFCRDGVCTFINGKLYSIDYPETWKVDTSASSDLSKVKLIPAEGWADITIVKAASSKGTPVSEVAANYIRDLRLTKGPSFYVISNEAASGAWDWYIEYYEQSSGKILRTQVHLKNSGAYLYSLYALAEDKAYSAYSFQKDFDKITSSFKLLY
jgi:hypothetical protein